MLTTLVKQAANPEGGRQQLRAASIGRITKTKHHDYKNLTRLSHRYARSPITEFLTRDEFTDNEPDFGKRKNK